MKPDIVVTHEAHRRCFETIVDGLRCELDYVLDGDVMRITHTGVPRPLEGRGIAAELVRTGLSWARNQGLKVNPVCSYVAVYMRRHPEWSDLRV